MPINPNDLPAIQQLQRGQFAYPDIPFADGPLKRTSTTILGAYSTIMNCGLGQYLDDLTPDWKRKANIQWQNKMIETINNSLVQMINFYRENPNDELLTRIFIRIQLWGGKMGQGVFTRGKRFQGNFDVGAYKEAVSIVDENPKEALRRLLCMAQIGLSFATKHLFFWGTNLPILDERIMMLLYGNTLLPPGEIRKVNLYMNYIDNLDGIVGNDSDLSRLIVERSLFNWIDTPHGVQWCCIREANG